MRHFMKIALQILFCSFFLTILSCKKNNVEKTVQKISPERIVKPFFDYDEIEYFHNDVNNSLEGASEIYRKLENRKIDSLEFKILIGNIPENSTDTTFVKKLNQIGYNKINLSKEKQNELRQIFVEKSRNSEPKDALKPIFNDVLIFRKQNKIVGFSKLSFKYLQSRIIGSKLNSDYFPTNAEHKQIEKILYEK